MTALWHKRYAAFPPHSAFLMLPRDSRRAAMAGLTLYEAVTPRQRAAAAVARVLLRSGFHRVLPENRRGAVAWGWWERWLTEVGERHVGAIEHVAFRMPASGRLCALLMDPNGRPVGFAKILDHALAELSVKVRSRLTAEPLPRHFRVPQTMDEGEFDGFHYVLFEALPEGGHRRPPPDPDRVHTVIDEIRDRLGGLSRPASTAPHHVVCHAGFTPRNVRVTRDGRWWVFDWDAVRWAPRLSYEVRYWTGEFAYRLRPKVPREAERVLRLLRQRGSDDEIIEAIEWPHQSPTHRAIERDIYEAVIARIRAETERRV